MDCMGGRKFRVSNYSKTKLIQLLHTTIRDVLPLSPEDWDVIAQTQRDNFPDTDRSVQNLCRKYTNPYRRQIPTGDPNFLEEVKMAKRIKWLIKNNAEASDGEEEFDLEEDYYKNSNTSSATFTTFVANPSATNTAATNAATATSTFPTNSTNPTRTQRTDHRRHKRTGSNPRNCCALTVHFLFTVRFLSLSLRQYRNSKVNSQETLTFLRENSELKREQRRENFQLEREHREAVLEAERRQRVAALELLKAAIIDVATLFVNWLLKSNSTAKDSPGAGDYT
eukprot:jgi/Psemu1/50907/gm1.50907_g